MAGGLIPLLQSHGRHALTQTEFNLGQCWRGLREIMGGLNPHNSLFDASSREEGKRSGKYKHDLHHDISYIQ